MLRLSLSLLLAPVVFAQAPPPRLGTILHNNGILSQVYGPADAPTVEQKPSSSTKHVHFVQAAAHEAWAATTPDSVLYGKGAFRSRRPLPSRPRALAISPDGNTITVALDGKVEVYTPSTSVQAFPIRKLLTMPDIPAGTSLDLAITNTAMVFLSTPSTTYVAGMDNRFTQAPSHFTLFYHARLAYDTTSNVVVFVRYSSFTNKFTNETVGTSDDGLSAPTGLAISADDKVVWVSLPGESNLASITLATRAVRAYSLPSAGSLRSTTQPGIYFWSDTSLLDTTGAEPHLVDIKN